VCMSVGVCARECVCVSPLSHTHITVLGITASLLGVCVCERESVYKCVREYDCVLSRSRK